ncbi:MAG: family 10 glycosylhydrolase [Archangium sp.]|nr:family 10 glycosylhydrolase [Archangium sp.]
MLRRVSLCFVVAAAACSRPVISRDGGPDGSVPVDGGPQTTVDAGDFDASMPFDSGVEAPDAGGFDASVPFDAGTFDAGVFDAGVVELVAVSHQRELRGVWVATVSNLDFPLATGLSVTTARGQLQAIVDRAVSAGLNSLFFQVRPESDALYESTLEPWSRFLSGTQGQHPGWDPLAELLTMAHRQGVEVHAWVNPYRGAVSAGSTRASNHVTQTLSAHAITYNSQVVMNPGVPAVRAHVMAVLRDLLNRYDVDGLHFDDYFYPYPDSSNTPFPDSATYSAYQSGGGMLSLNAWRRDNVNTLVRETMQMVTAEHPQVRFGVSPFGIWQSGTPSGIVGLSAYDTIACDAPTWMNQGWVDYLAPQLYWARSPTQQAFGTLINWWANGATGGRHVFPGHALYRLNSSATWTVDEIRQQILLVRAQRAKGALGSLHFREAQLRTNVLGIADAFRNDLYAAKALPPPIPRAGASMTPVPPLVTRSGSTLIAQHPLPATVRFAALYRLQGSTWTLTSVSGDAVASFPSLPSGTYAISAVARGGAESMGVRHVVP